MKTEYLLNKELGHVLAALTPSNALVMKVSLQTGLRVSDVLNLKSAQLKNRFWVTEGKTGKKRMVGLDTGLIESILSLSGGSVWAFPGRGGSKRPRTRQSVWKDVKRASTAFRLPQNVGPHSARKIYAVRLMEKYGDLKRVQKALRHSSQSVTAVYAMADMLLERKRQKRARKAP